jgi:PIN domain nuclease of toxin-antitoxin system
MTLLLDTHVILWTALSPRLIPARTFELLRNMDNVLLISAVTCWEIATKVQTGKLVLPVPLEEFLDRQIADLVLTPLPLTRHHATRVATLPGLHRDPADRLLIAQAQLERVPIVTSDALIRRYDVEVIW